MKLFAPPSFRRPPLPPVPGLEDQRRLVARGRAEARRWLVRSVLLLVISAIAFRRGWILFALVFLALALLGAQLARSTRRRAIELAALLQRQAGA